ncbi:glycosyltransferase 61 family protein [Amaricoccus solimangrovi]|uniref:Glycosyltransferase family 61 protein n=1 Tax=Amaricoccus solimangrovi TaxID=2589815 RepID=A0A501WUK2_9RHOB|nr:glycosyltransferase family 61 protein [Amaricoccus solimangrovi]TPE53098.1 glycosyltransferase family 61 protein [Amaricoccus solimangrovi]
MLSWRPAMGLVRRLVGGGSGIEALARERWEIAPPETRFVPPALFLEGQIERIRATRFGTAPEVVRHLRGGFETREGPTLGHALRGVDLVDGVLYAGSARRHLRPEAKARLLPPVPEEHASGVLYESWAGNRWFGNWLTDDCLAYALAECFGPPVATAPAPTGHARDYEHLLGQSPRRFARRRFDELILLDDQANNADRRARAERMSARLRAGIDAPPRPGVFLTRGESGDRRLLINEAEIATRLRDRHGFAIVDPLAHDARGLIAACAGARVIAGVEGSHLCHGLVAMDPEATLLTLQPPDRVTSVLKIVTDRRGQGFALILGAGGSGGFHVPPAEVEATLDVIARRRGL